MTIEQLYEANYSHFDFIEAMNGGDCDCEIHKQIQALGEGEGGK